MYIKKKILTLLLTFTIILQSVLMCGASTDQVSNIVIDISQPPISLSAFTITNKSIELVWVNNDNSIITTTYDIYRDGSIIRTVEGFTYTDTELASNTEYKYIIKAKNNEGNVIAESNILTLKTLSLNDEYTKQDDINIIKNGGPDFICDRFIIKYKDNKISEKFVNKFKDKLKSSKKIESKNGKFNLITTADKLKVSDFVAEIKNRNMASDIEYIQPDYQMNLSSNDVYFNTQWGLQNEAVNNDRSNSQSATDLIWKLSPHLRDAINESPQLMYFFMNTPLPELKQKIIAGEVPECSVVLKDMLEELAHEPAILEDEIASTPSYKCDAGVSDAWQFSTGKGVTVAVLDTGVDGLHEDLADNIWINPKEIAGNGVDDDNNGKVDDINGWNFADNNNLICDYTNINNENHGTHIAGIISAVMDNGIGVSGVAPCSKIIPLKVFKDGAAFTSDIIEAIQYAESLGVKIVNCSWGSNTDNPALKEAISDSGMLFICAAGNSGYNIDNNPIYPASFDCNNIITVTSINKNGNLSGFSNFGEVNVDVAAPGEGIQSTLAGNKYGEMNGTSMAAAFVSGEAALLLSSDATISIEDCKNRIISCSDHLSSLAGKVYGNNKINCLNSVNNIKSKDIIYVPNVVSEQNNNPMLENPGSFSLFSAPTMEGQLSKISAGMYHSLALKTDGTVWAYGFNYYGQLGDGTTTNKASPVKINSLSGITAIAGGTYHSLALKSDGTVWSWGYNGDGQLGDGTTVSKSTPVQVSGLSGITAIACGNYFSLALKNDGSVWAWGANYYGQLGDGSITQRNIAVQVSGLTGVTAISGGYAHSLAIKNDGTVWSWGYNNRGQLGNGNTTNSSTAVQVGGLSGISAIASGHSHNLALKNDGTVWSWGFNESGQLGDGTTTDRTTAIQVSSLGGITKVAAGYYHSLAVKNDGSLWAWGYNALRQIGDGTTTNRNTAVQVPGASTMTAVAGGYYHSVALKNDGTVWAWGNNYYGQVGDGTTSVEPLALQTNGLSGITKIASRYSHSLVLKNDGTVWAFGYNNYGQIGDGTAINRAEPVQVYGLSGITSIAGGTYHSLAVKSDGTVWSWGFNSDGELGDGTTTSKYVAVQVSGLTGITAVECGNYFSLALKNDGTVWAWGANYYGQLGDGSTTQRNLPVQVSGLSGITAIACGYGHSMALKSDGTVWTWGLNGDGQLGDNTKVNKSIAAQVSGLSGMTAIAAGYVHSLALKSDGTVRAWGYNGFGQLGDGTTTTQITPVQVSNLSGVISIASGYYHSMAIKNDNTVWAFGYNYFGQLGDGTTANRSVAVQTIGLSGISSVKCGDSHSLALKSNGTVWAWGNNYRNQLGNGEKQNTEYAKWVFGTPTISPISVPCNITCTAGKPFNLVLKAQNYRCFVGRTFEISYFQTDINSVTDLCRMTYPSETAAGPIPGTGITILQNIPGSIKFTVNKPIDTTDAWSGIVNIITFKPAVSGSIVITCKIS